MRRPMILAGALLALPFLAPPVAMAKSHHKVHHSTGTKPNSAAYPGAPGGQPAAADKGKPVAPKGDAGAKPPPPAAASSEGAKPGGVAAPSAAYPGSPAKTPAAGATSGNAPK